MLDALSWGLHLIVLTGVCQLLDATARYLIDRDIAPDSRVMVIENPACPDEKITSCSLAGVSSQRFGCFSVMVGFNKLGVNKRSSNLRLKNNFLKN